MKITSLIALICLLKTRLVASEGLACWSFNTNVDRSGADLDHLLHSSVLDCKIACENNPSCTFMVFKPSTEECWLRNNDGLVQSVEGLDYYEPFQCPPTSASQETCLQSASSEFASTITINSVSGNTAVIYTDTTASFNYVWHREEYWCPGCIIQIYAGFRGYTTSNCINFEGTFVGDNSLSYSMAITTPGCYRIFRNEQLGYNCNYYGAVSDGEIIGAIWAIPKGLPTVTPTVSVSPTIRPSSAPSIPTTIPTIKPTAPSLSPTTSPSITGV
eukprot:gene4823-9619_t